MSKVAKKITWISSVGSNEVSNFPMKRSYSGFTLLELTMVMFFMALISGLATPFAMSLLDRMELHTSARQITSALRYARSEAITVKKPVIFNGDLTNNQFWVTSSHKNLEPRIVSLNNPVRLDRFL